MKLKNIFLAISVLLLTCCKQAEYPIDNPSSYTHLFMSMANNGLNERSMAIKNVWEKIAIGVGYGGVEANSSDLEIELIVDKEAIDQYNEQNGTDYDLAPEGSYRLTDDKVSIKSGSSGSNTIQLEVNPSLLRGTRAYLIPVSIVRNSKDLPVVAGLGTTYFLVSGFYEDNPFTPISISEWKIVNVSSENSDAIGGLGPFCIDGDLQTCWLSQYRRFPDGTRPVHPHYVTIDMNNLHELHGIQIYGRSSNEGQSSQDYLFPTNVHIEASNDGVTWNSVGTFTMSAAPARAPAGTMYFEEVTTCRYFKVTVLKSQGNGDTTAIAELTAF